MKPKTFEYPVSRMDFTRSRRSLRQRLFWVAIAVLLLAISSALSNLTSPMQLSGQANEVLFPRLILSMFLNDAIVWAGLAVFAGFMLRGLVLGAFGGFASLLGAVVAHYLFEILIGNAGTSVFSTNLYWFVTASVIGPVLGMVGALARRPDSIGLLSGLVLPVGAVVEPIYLGRIPVNTMLPWANYRATYVVNIAIIILGLIGMVFWSRIWLLRRLQGRKQTPAPPATSSEL